MSKFVYEFENLLNIKEKLEEQKKLIYSDKLQQYSLEEQVLLKLHKKRSNYEKQFKDNIAICLKAQELKGYYYHIEALKGLCEEQENVLKKVKQQMEDALEDMNNAMIDRKTFERLREKAELHYIKEFKREENKEIDEIISYRFRPNNGEVNYGK